MLESYIFKEQGEKDCLEDAVGYTLSSEGVSVWTVCDGRRGEGEIASEYALNEFNTNIKNNLSAISDPSEEKIIAEITKILTTINDNLLRTEKGSTTLTSLVKVYEEWYVVSVGDSELHGVTHEGTLEKLTEDETAHVIDLSTYKTVENERLAVDDHEGPSHYLGMRGFEVIQCKQIDPSDYRGLFLSTDGITGRLSDRELLKSLMTLPIKYGLEITLKELLFNPEDMIKTTIQFKEGHPELRTSLDSVPEIKTYLETNGSNACISSFLEQYNFDDPIWSRIRTKVITWRKQYDHRRDDAAGIYISLIDETDRLVSHALRSQKELAERTAEYEEARQQIAAYEQQVGGLTAANQDLSVRVDAATAGIASLETTLETERSSAGKRIGALETDLTTIQAERDGYQRESGEKDDVINAYLTDKKAKTDEIQRLKDELSNTVQELKTYEAESKKKKGIIVTIKDSLTSSKKELKDKDQEIAGYKAEVSALKINLESAVQSGGAYQVQAEESARGIATLNKTNAALRTELEDARGTITVYETNAATLKEEKERQIVGKDAEILAKAQAIVVYHQRVAEYDATVAGLRQQITSLEERLSHSTEEITALRGELNIFNKKDYEDVSGEDLEEYSGSFSRLREIWSSITNYFHGKKEGGRSLSRAAKWGFTVAGIATAIGLLVGGGIYIKNKTTSSNESNDPLPVYASLQTAEIEVTTPEPRREFFPPQEVSDDRTEALGDFSGNKRYVCSHLSPQKVLVSYDGLVYFTLREDGGRSDTTEDAVHSEVLGILQSFIKNPYYVDCEQSYRLGDGWVVLNEAAAGRSLSEILEPSAEIVEINKNGKSQYGRNCTLNDHKNARTYREFWSVGVWSKEKDMKKVCDLTTPLNASEGMNVRLYHQR